MDTGATELRRRHQLVLLEMLKEFDRICRRHDIKLKRYIVLYQSLDCFGRIPFRMCKNNLNIVSFTK